MDRVGIDGLSVFGLPPVQFVQLAASLGCQYISTGIGPVGSNLTGSPNWSLSNGQIRRDMARAMQDHGVSISLGEGFGVYPGKDTRDLAANLAIMRELGVPVISAISVDPDLQRSLDQLAVLGEMAKQAGAMMVVEFIPDFTIHDLPGAVAAVRHIGSDKARILVDCMHLVRSGSTAADIAALAPNLIGYAQLCDAPLVSRFGSYLEEAMYERMVPGEGELPLQDILAALPRDVVIGLEIPRRSRLEAGEGPRERLAPCVEAARKLIALMTNRR